MGAWVSTERRYLLADAKVQGADGTPLQMEVATGSKVDNGTGFTSEPYLNSAEEAQNRIATILDGPRLLSEELQVQLRSSKQYIPSVFVQVGHACKGWRTRACSTSTGGEFGDGDPLDGPAFTLAQSGKTMVAQGGRDCDIPVDDGEEAGWPYTSMSPHAFDTLPFMTLGATEERHQCVLLDGVQPLSDLFTFGQFLRRVGLAKEQATFFGIERIRLGALQWMQRVETAEGHDDSDKDKLLAVTDIPMIFAHAGSRIGNVDSTLPTEYPLPPNHTLSPYSSRHTIEAGYVIPPPIPSSASGADTAPKIVVVNSSIHLHARPAELYLSAASSRGRLGMAILYDENVFEEGVVRVA
ncbi:hypothetical protein HD554DRAFT_2036482 [Boletus coccyginus]|nr:hypothetical protein HD554DRAFT_2036482 [Boletus coccyginus]